MRKKENIEKLCNLNYLSITNKTICSGVYDLPILHCAPKELPDYIALYSHPSEYNKTLLTAVGFYNYDIQYDGINGLYASIYYDNKKRQEQFKQKFKGVKFFISPDYTIAGDAPFYQNINRIGIAREVAVWLTLNTNAIVIPNISCCCEDDLSYICDGLENVTTVAFSTKARTKSIKDRELLYKAVDMTLKRLKSLKNIIVYDVSAGNKVVNEVFENARNSGINVVVPDNLLKNRNRMRRSINV